MTNHLTTYHGIMDFVNDHMIIMSYPWFFFLSASHERLLALYDRLDELDASKATAKAGYILHGLGFTKEMQGTKVSIRSQCYISQTYPRGRRKCY